MSGATSACRSAATNFLRSIRPAGDEPNGKRRPGITFVASDLPFPLHHGGLIVTHCMIQALARFASVSVVVLTPGRYDEETVRAAEEYYTRTCRSFVCYQFPHLNPSSSNLTKGWHYLSGYPRQGFWSKEAEQLLCEHLQAADSEVLWCNAIHEAKYLRMAKRMGLKTVMMTHNVESDVVRQQIGGSAGFSWLKATVRWADMRRLEKMAGRWADIITAITPVDHSYYVRLKGNDRAFLLPFSYQIAENETASGGILEEPHTICFVGSMDWPPNSEAAHFLVERVMPLVWQEQPAAKCYLVGRNPPPELYNLASDRVIVTGAVQSIREYYDRASVMVVPVRAVAGVKIKLIEALALGKAVICSPEGTAGLDVEHEKELMIAESADSFARNILNLLANKGNRDRLGANARRFVEKKLSPAVTEQQVEAILEYLKSL